MTIAAKLAAALTSVFLFAGVPAEATTPDTKPAAPAKEDACKTKPAPGGSALRSALGSGMGAVAGKPNAAACAPEKPAKPAPQKPAPKP